MEIALATKQQLANLLAKPTLVTQAHAELLAKLVKTYPYYQPLHLLLARAMVHTEHQNPLANAALYNSGGLLHKVVYQPESLLKKPIQLVVLSEEAMADDKPSNELTEVALNTAPIETDEQETFEEIAEVEHKSEVEPREEPAIEFTEVALNETLTETDEQEASEEIAEFEHKPEVETQEEPAIEFTEVALNETLTETDEQETFDEIAEFEHQPEVETQEEPVKEFTEVMLNATLTDETDEQETFDEIAEVTIKPTPVNSDEDAVFDEISETNSFSIPKPFDAPVATPSAAALPIDSIVGIDFFAFEKSQTEKKAEKETEIPKVEPKFVAPEEYNLAAEAQTVSKYDDDKLPYTFLWWLAKTRKEHEQIFQPYVSQKKNNQPANELQQQYVEHIFHLQTPFHLSDEMAKGPLNRLALHKGSEIIEKFIKNEPQIRPLKPEQLNNENKAKRSAEDNYDLVSETLAAIYIEQTLYHKAIDTYEKLSLKFPEKSRYFADLIQSLEKKI